MIKRGSSVKTNEGICGIIEDIIPHFSSHHDLDAVYLQGRALPYFRWQCEEIVTPKSEPVQKLLLRFKVPGMPNVSQEIEAEVIGEPLRVVEGAFVIHAKGVPTEEANDYFVMVKFKGSGNIDWCNIASLASPPGRTRGLGTLAECKEFVRKANHNLDQFFIFKLSAWKYCT